jgi:hypothetical protein
LKIQSKGHSNTSKFFWFCAIVVKIGYLALNGPAQLALKYIWIWAFSVQIKSLKKIGLILWGPSPIFSWAWRASPYPALNGPPRMGSEVYRDGLKNPKTFRANILKPKLYIYSGLVRRPVWTSPFWEFRFLDQFAVLIWINLDLNTPS